MTVTIVDRIGSALRRLLPRPWAEDAQFANRQIGLLVWAGVVGAVGAGVASLLRLAGDAAQAFVWSGSGDIVHLVQASESWRRLLLPAAGGVTAGLCLYWGLRMARAAGGWDILEAVALRDGILRFRPALVKCLASLLTTTTAGSVGREGPMVLLSATLASKIGRLTRMPTRRLRVLTACGVAAGMASAYNAPIGAALFAMEIILGNFAMEVLAPLVFASVIGTLVARTAYGAEPILTMPSFEMVSAWEVIPYLILGVVGGVLASLFLVFLRGAAAVSARIPVPQPLLMGGVGLILGVVILRYPQVSGGGRGLDSLLTDPSGLWQMAAIVLILKLMLTSMTMGSGAVGGVFTPSLFVGASAGIAFGTLVHAAAPAHTADPGAYALVGMGCVLAGMTHAPLMAIILIFELSLNYSIVLPLMLSCAAASLVARSLTPTSVYTEALSQQDAALATPEAQVMTSLTVREIMRDNAVTVASDASLPQVLDRFLQERRTHLYVTDADRHFLGAISMHDLKEAMAETEDVSFILAVDLIRPFATTFPDERLDQVMERFWRLECERLPVTDPAAGNRLVGTVSKRDILGVYTLEVLHRKTMVTKFRASDRPERDATTYVELPADHRVDGIPVASVLEGRSLREVALRDRFGVTVLMIRRRGPTGADASIVPNPETILRAGDRLVVFGPDAGLAALRDA